MTDNSENTQMVLATPLGHVAAEKDDPQSFILRLLAQLDDADDVRDEQGAQFENLANGYQQAKAQIERLALETVALKAPARKTD